MVARRGPIDDLQATQGGLFSSQAEGQETADDIPCHLAVGNKGEIRFCDNMDVDNGVPSLDNESIALTFTSPPYWNFVDYGGHGSGAESSYRQYIAGIGELLCAIAGKTVQGGRVVVNASNMKSRTKVEGRAFIYPIVPDIIREADNAGLIFFDEIIWVKGHANAGALKGRPLFGSYPYPPTPKILDSIFENILIFTKPGRRAKPDPEVKARSRLSKAQWAKFTKGIWEIAHDRDPYHPATFPMEIADRIIRMYSFVGDVVLDPFAGTGTTLVAAEQLGRQSIGFEIHGRYRQAVAAKVAQWISDGRIDNHDGHQVYGTGDPSGPRVRPECRPRDISTTVGQS